MQFRLFGKIIVVNSFLIKIRNFKQKKFVMNLNLLLLYFLHLRFSILVQCLQKKKSYLLRLQKAMKYKQEL